MFKNIIFWGAKEVIYKLQIQSNVYHSLDIGMDNDREWIMDLEWIMS